MKPLRRLTVLPTLPEQLAPLRELAGNLRWTWHRPTRDLFAAVDPVLWDAVAHNPLRLLSELHSDRVAELVEDRAFLDRLRAAAADLQRYLAEPGWYQTLADAPRSIAYFSPEFGLTETMPQYSGGLGVLAGDHLKTASDLGLPLVGVGLFYRCGYFSQTLSPDGRQQESYPTFDPYHLPLEPAVAPQGGTVEVEVKLPDGLLRARVWRARVGRVTLLLLDTAVPGNPPGLEGITDRLYGGDSEARLRQEILLGIGGVRALAACGIEPEVFHTNEGHAGFLGLERIRRLVEQGLDGPTALEAVRAGTIFTTHTPVPAGIDRFQRDLIERYFGPDGVDTGMSVDELLALGRDEHDAGVFNMAVMGLALAQRANGVSRLHGEVSRGMFAWRWPSFELSEVPIGHVTNGVHGGTWVDDGWQSLYERVLGRDWADGGGDWAAALDPGSGKVDDAELWALRDEARHRLVDDARVRLRAAWLGRGASQGQLAWVDRVLDPNVLTIGFARRVPSYKRLTLILRDPARLKRLLLDPERPVQLVVAGKAHPADEGGKAMIHEFTEFAADPAVRHRVVFLPDYDMAMARVLVAGTDVWLNNPLRPFEACGTSGMKAALNGCLNLSIRDGWWDEMYDGLNGWAIPSFDLPGVSQSQRDDAEAAAIFDLLEQEVVPLFYDRDEGLPRRWIGRVRYCLASLGPEVLASRMVRDYTEQLYVPAARRSRALAADGHAAAAVRASRRAHALQQWPQVAVWRADAAGSDHELGSSLPLRAVVSLGELAPDEVRVEALYGKLGPDDELANPNSAALRPTGERDGDGWVFETELPLTTPGSFGYTVRVLPRLHDDDPPAELGLVTWA
jgi:glycogen phosphorylase